MSKYGYVGKESDIPQQAFKSNAGVLSVNDHLALSQENKLTQFGQLELIETQTASNVNALDFTSIQESTYNVHFITVTNFSAVSSSTGGRLQLLESGVAKTTGYQFAYEQSDNGTFTEQKSTNGSSMVSYDFDPVTPRNSYAYIYNAGDSSKYTFLTSQFTTFRNTAEIQTNFNSGVRDELGSCDGFEFATSGGNITEGVFSCYGIRYS